MGPIRSILISVALLLLGNGLINTLLALRGTAEGFSTPFLGLIMSGYFAGFICGSFAGRHLIRRMRHIRTFAFCAAICASAALLHLVFIDPWVWLGLRFVYGLSYITLITVIESWLNSQAVPSERGRIFAIYMAVNLGALALAQQILRLGSTDGPLLFLLVSILICWALLPITLTSKPEPEVSGRPRANLRALASHAPLPVAAALLSGLAMGAFWAMTPVYTVKLGLDNAGVALVMSLAIVGGAIFQIPVGRYSDRHDRPRVLNWIVLLAAGTAALMPLAPSPEVLTGLYFLWGGLAFTLYPLSVAQMVDQLPRDEMVAGSSAMLMLHGAGCALAPVLAGSLMGVLGIHALPIYIALVLAGLGGFIFYRRRRVTDLTRGTAGHFEPMVQAGPESLDLAFEDQKPNADT
ncbi:MFS transporter [Marinobacter confluentis]|uniref:MFS transporter n=1 Tax=Marinobacter confluentis TaxID=1697557 RepID=A0A4Z1BIZ4_9GAMM|nr:MFS transporter [Marinobacter confluentis]